MMRYKLPNAHQPMRNGLPAEDHGRVVPWIRHCLVRSQRTKTPYSWRF